MGISKEFIKSVKFIKFGHIALLLCLFIPWVSKAQNNSNDIPVNQNGKKYYKHIVVKGETVYGIAERFNLQPKDIVFDNPKAIDGIHTGDTLLIQTNIVATDNDEKKGNYIFHNVIAKETVYSLSKKYNTSIRVMDSLNPDLTTRGLQISQVLRIPAKNYTMPPPSTTPPVVNNTPPPIVPAPQAKVNSGNSNKKETEAYKSLLGVKPVSDTTKPHSVITYKDTGKKLSRYNIALIMPFASDDTLHVTRLVEGTEQIPQKTQGSIDFYHGIVMALDSLAKKGFKANLYVYNIMSSADSSTQAVDSILKKPEMLRMNLIIGPPSSFNFKRAARFASIHHIAIVSPFSPESSVLKNNLWTSKAVPSTIAETEAEANFIAAHYKHANIILIHNKGANDECYEVFKNSFRKADSALGVIDSLHYAESIGGVSGLKSKISKFASNVIVMPYQGAPFVAKFVNELANSYTYAEMVMFGMHNWKDNDALSADNLDTLNFHFPSNEFLNYADSSTKKLIVKYKNYYLAEPSKYAFQGFDLGMFYGKLLWTYGTDMQNHLGDMKYNGLQTSFNMLRTDSIGGYENKSVYILEYENYTERLDSK